MKSIVALPTLTLSVEKVIGGCHTDEWDDQWFGIETSSDTDWAHSDDGLYANIYAGGSWKGWRKFNNENCDDYQQGAVDYFDDFETVTSQWEAAALCMFRLFMFVVIEKY